MESAVSRKDRKVYAKFAKKCFSRAERKDKLLYEYKMLGCLKKPGNHSTR